MAAPAIPLLVPVEEYLRTEYDPDCDYLEGVLEERHMGERDHGETEFAICTYFRGAGKRPGLRPFLEQRVQVSPRRFRVPDVCLVLGPKPAEQIFTKPPAIVIEVLSPEDRLPRMQRRVADFLDFGVSVVWLIDPVSRVGWVWDRAGMRQLNDGVFRSEEHDVTMPLAEIFRIVDED